MKTGTWDTRHGPEERRNLESHGQLPCYSQLRINQHMVHKCAHRDGHKGPCQCYDCKATWLRPKGHWKNAAVKRETYTDTECLDWLFATGRVVWPIGSVGGNDRARLYAAISARDIRNMIAADETKDIAVRRPRVSWTCSSCQYLNMRNKRACCQCRRPRG